MTNEPIIDPTKGQRPQQRINQRAGAERSPERDEMREQPRERTRTRLLSAAPPTHDNYVNLDAVPPDTSLEWKRFNCNGQEYPYYLQQMRKQGWEPVNPQEHPDWVSLPPGYDAVNVIVDGQILMERPMRLTLQAREDDEIMSKRRMAEAKQRAGQKSDDREAEREKPQIIEEIGRMVPQPE